MDLFKYYDDGRKTEDEHSLAMSKVQETNMLLTLQRDAMRDAAVQRTAISKFDPKNPSSIDLVMADLAKGGDFQGVVKLQDVKEQWKTRELNQEQLSTRMMLEKNQMLGGLINSITDQKSYDNAIQRMIAMKIDPSQFGMSGKYDVDKDHLKTIAASTLTFKEALDEKRADIQWKEHQATQARLEQNHRDMLARQQFLERMESSRLRLAEDAAKERAQKERLAQSGREERLHIVQQRLANPTKNQMEMAYQMITGDDRFKEMPEASRRAVAQNIAGKATKAIAQTLSPDNPSWTPESVEDEINRQIDKAFEDGWVTPYTKKEGWFAKNEPAKFVREKLGLSAAPPPGPAGKPAPAPAKPSSKEEEVVKVKPPWSQYNIGDAVTSSDGKKHGKVLGWTRDGKTRVQWDTQ